MWSAVMMAKAAEILCPWCGEFDLPNSRRAPQLERLADGRSWLCNTCSHVFTLSRAQGDGDGRALSDADEDEETVH